MRPSALGVIAVAAVAAAAPAAAAENPQPELAVSQNGEPVTVRTALVADKGDGSVELFFSSATPSCREILASMRRRAPDEVSFELTRTEWGDGTSQWMAYYAGNTEPPTEGSEIEVELDPAKGATSTGRLAVLFRGFHDGDELRVEGTFEAVGCGAR